MDTKSLEKVEGVISRGCDYSLCLSHRRMKIWRDEAFAGRCEDPGEFVCEYVARSCDMVGVWREGEINKSHRELPHNDC